MKEKKTTLTIRLEVEVTNQDIDDIMACALEGGINYWADEAEVVGKYLGEYGSEQIARGGELIIHLGEPIEEAGTMKYKLTKEKFMNGLRKYLNDPMKPYNIVEWDNKNYEYRLDTCQADAVVCDMIIQYALFDEIVFA